MPRTLTVLVVFLLTFFRQEGAIVTISVPDKGAEVVKQQVVSAAYVPDPPGFVSDKVAFAALINAGWQKIRKAEAAGEVEWYTTDAKGQKHSNWEAVKKQLGLRTRIIVFHNTGDLPPWHLGLLHQDSFWEVISECDQKRLYFDPLVSASIIHPNHFNPQGQEWYVAYSQAFLPDGRDFVGLTPDQVGFQSGNRPVNLMSEGWVMVGNFTTGKPSDLAMKSAAAELRAKVDALCRDGLTCGDIWIISHRTAMEDRAYNGCPGDWWFSGGREELIRMAGLDPSQMRGEPTGWSKVPVGK